MDDPDVRTEELETLQAIYQDLAAIDFSNYSGTITVPLALEKNVAVYLSKTGESQESRNSTVSYLPPLILSFKLPQNYPYDDPPEIQLHSVSMDSELICELFESLINSWHDIRDQVLFTMVDFLQQKTYEYADSLKDQSIDCHGDQALYDQICTFNQDQTVCTFNESTFTCEICQNDLKGLNCVEFSECGHVFCQSCLKDFFISLIDSGDVEKVHCPDFECGKKEMQMREKYLRLDFLQRENFDFEEFRSRIMTPPIRPEVLQRILGNDSEGYSAMGVFGKYTSIYTDHQHALIAKLFPMRLVACPRTHCDSMIFRENTQDRLVICRKCQYAFCNTCRKSFHSSSIDCAKAKDEKLYHGIAIEDIEVWISEGKATPAGNELRCRYGHELLRKVADEYTMDQLFNELLREESNDFSKCPTCDIVIQRSEGCNKMRCSHCYTIFCHLCSTFLDQDHPYDHFKEKTSPCYNMLFQGMPGTEGMMGEV